MSAPAIAESVRECRAGVISKAPAIAFAAASMSATVIGKTAFKPFVLSVQSGKLASWPLSRKPDQRPQRAILTSG